MGMFDYVATSHPCRECGTEVLEWQSKDSQCMMEVIPLHRVCGYYGACPKCGAWHEFRRQPDNTFQDVFAPEFSGDDHLGDTT